MYRKVLKEVIKDLEKTDDLIDVSKYLNESCTRSDFLNIINELLNQLSEEKATVQNMNCKMKKLKAELNKTNKKINQIKSSLAEENIEII